MVIGRGGAGKSTLSAELGERLGLPVVHLDRLFWRPGWAPMPRDEWRALQHELVREERWVIDGNYGNTLDVRTAAADTVIFLDVPAHLALAGVLRRWWRHRGRAVQAEGCPERWDWTFLRWVIWDYSRRSRPRALATLEQTAAHADVIVLRSRRQMRAFLAALA